MWVTSALVQLMTGAACPALLSLLVVTGVPPNCPVTTTLHAFFIAFCPRVQDRRSSATAVQATGGEHARRLGGGGSSTAVAPAINPRNVSYIPTRFFIFSSQQAITHDVSLGTRYAALSAA